MGAGQVFPSVANNASTCRVNKDTAMKGTVTLQCIDHCNDADISNLSIAPPWPKGLSLLHALPRRRLYQVEILRMRAEGFLTALHLYIRQACIT